jgi:hypothetical protein
MYALIHFKILIESKSLKAIKAGTSALFCTHGCLNPHLKTGSNARQRKNLKE